MSLEVSGKLLVKYDTQQVSEKFKKREFVLELAEEINGNIYTNFAKMQLVQNKCEIIDRFKEGDLVKVSFNIKGNRWERDGKVNYITNLDAWRMESATAAPTGGQPQQPQQQAPQGYNNGGYNNNNGGGNSNFNAAPANYNPSPETIDDLPF
jgi:single-stranded DNA-binding protein